MARLIDQLNAKSFRWAVFDLTTNLGVPVAAALIEGHSPVGSILAFGSACHPNPVRAISKSLSEAAHCRMYVKSLLRERPARRSTSILRRLTPRPFAQVTSFADHARFYSTHPEHKKALNHWLENGEESHVMTPLLSDNKDLHKDPIFSEGWLSDQTKRIQRMGYEALTVDLTPPEIRDLGLWVARVLIPALHPLHGNHLWPHLGGHRLRHLSQVFGPWAKQPRRWNRYPHPCP